MPWCHICDKTFSRRSTLERHLREVHEAEDEAVARVPPAAASFERFPCPACGWEVVEDRRNAHLSVFLCYHCHHFISHTTHEDMGPGVLRAEVEMERQRAGLDPLGDVRLRPGPIPVHEGLQHKA